jgi:hypothetical protein
MTWSCATPSARGTTSRECHAPGRLRRPSPFFPGVDQLGHHPDPLAVPAQAAFRDVIDARSAACVSDRETGRWGVPAGVFLEDPREPAVGRSLADLSACGGGPPLGVVNVSATPPSALRVTRLRLERRRARPAPPRRTGQPQGCVGSRRNQASPSSRGCHPERGRAGCPCDREERAAGKRITQIVLSRWISSGRLAILAASHPRGSGPHRRPGSSAPLRPDQFHAPRPR